MSRACASPLFTVVVPTFNREQHIGQCLDSIVLQERTDIEVVVVDNASSDQTVEIATGYSERLSLRVLTNELNRERSYSRNRGAQDARGRFLVFLDSDDRLTPGALDRAAQFLQANPDRLFFFQLLRIVDEGGSTVYRPVVRLRKGIGRTLAEGNPLSCSGVYVERSLFQRHKFSEVPDLVGSEDWHCWIRIAAEHEPVLCPGDGALLVDHGSRTVAADQWKEAERRFSRLTDELLNDSNTATYLRPFLNLFRGSQAHYVAVKAAQQSALGASVVLFARSLRYHPPLLASRRTLHLFRLWLRTVVKWLSNSAE